VRMAFKVSMILPRISSITLILEDIDLNSNLSYAHSPDSF
jgi:hypothetical protein